MDNHGGLAKAEAEAGQGRCECEWGWGRGVVVEERLCGVGGFVVFVLVGGYGDGGGGQRGGVYVRGCIWWKASGFEWWWGIG